ncbi:hypothetical protein JR316_0000526 [Psilocybe cubensis]|uniref:Uncharacterized protein n=2 Tax=Psilocybe cubensis TaxID=181762 RepID=A0ACB8HG49_PSICU|nr:hypothetical protein JR316_0000526 [Psilocybe cubensis]KAH9486461.1 hypothetical protein JR316_0000526 [Psilocybe cubensis]
MEKIFIRLHLPCPQAPYWAVIVGENYEYQDSACHVSLDCLQVKLWIFPTHFGFSGGPWIDTTLDGFTADVWSSKDAPWWINSVRSNLISTILNGETVLLHAIATKLYFGTISKSLDVDEDGDGTIDEQGLFEGEVNNELRARCSTSQWNIVTPYGRMYTFGQLNAEFRRSWVDDRGTFAMIIGQCRLLKLRKSTVDVDHSVLWQIFTAISSLPNIALKTYRNPLSLIDIYVPHAQISFSDFRLRDAELLHESAVKLRQEYNQFTYKYPGVLENIAWDIFIGHVLSCLQD